MSGPELGQQRIKRRGAIGLDPNRHRTAGELVGADVDADEVRRQHEATVAIAVIVGRAEFGAGGNHQIGVRHQCAHRLEAGACRHAERMTMQQAARIGRFDDRRAQRFGEAP